MFFASHQAPSIYHTVGIAHPSTGVFMNEMLVASPPWLLHAKVGLSFTQLLVRVLDFHKKMLILCSVMCSIIKVYKFDISEQYGIFIEQVL